MLTNGSRLRNASLALNNMNMDFTLVNSSTKINRLQDISERLATMRNAKETDVTLYCADEVFFVHQSVVELSSPYFVAMFHCGLKETKSGQVVFEDMDPQVLQIILDYMYLGTVDQIQTVDQIEKLLQSSHLMQLEHLVAYCYDALAEQLSRENFVHIWNIAETYGCTTMLTKVFYYLMAGGTEVLYSQLFKGLSLEQLKEFLNFTSENFCNESLVAIVAWLKNDVQKRAKHAKILFEYVDVKMLSKTTIQMLAEDDVVMNSCEEIRNGVRDIGFALAYSIPRSSSVTTFENVISTKLGNVRIVFHSAYQFYCLTSNVETKVIAQLVHHVQDFDPCTMSWLPAITLPSKTGALIKSAEDLVIVQDDVLRTMTHPATINTHVLFPENDTQCSNPTFKYLNRVGNFWAKIRKPNCVKPSRNVVTSSKYIFIIGISEKSGDVVIEFNVLKYLTELDWHIIPSPRIPADTMSHFFVYKDNLCGFYYTKGELARIMFGHKQGKWFTKILPIGPPGITDVSCIYKGTPDECVVFVSTDDVTPQTPNFLWDPDSGKWTRLPLPKGTCELENKDQLQKIWKVV